MKHMISSKALCPYYLHEDAQVIYCEGVQDGSVIHLAFADRSTALIYKSKLCRRDYNKCPIFKMLEEKYKDDNNRTDKG